MAMETDGVFMRSDRERIFSNRNALSRKDSIMTESGREGQELAWGSGMGKAIGVFTSGGDSQGMSYSAINTLQNY